LLRVKCCGDACLAVVVVSRQVHGGRKR
jgi:hypothetical protein